MKEATRAAVTALAPVIANATRQAVNGTSGMLQQEAQAAVVKEVAAVVVNQTNQEPWYQSRVTWGALIAALAGLLGIFGFAFPADMQSQLVDIMIALGPVIGGALALYGRWAAKKPIGQ